MNQQIVIDYAALSMLVPRFSGAQLGKAVSFYVNNFLPNAHVEIATMGVCHDCQTFEIAAMGVVDGDPVLASRAEVEAIKCPGFSADSQPRRMASVVSIGNGMASVVSIGNGRAGRKR